MPTIPQPTDAKTNFLETSSSYSMVALRFSMAVFISRRPPRAGELEVVAVVEVAFLEGDGEEQNRAHDEHQADEHLEDSGLPQRAPWGEGHDRCQNRHE